MIMVQYTTTSKVVSLFRTNECFSLTDWYTVQQFSKISAETEQTSNIQSGWYDR